MTYSEIDAFLTIFDLGNFSAASDKLFITQPALSRKIMSLEKELGYKLFDRSRGLRSVQLTEEGKEFVPIARTLKTYMEGAKNISSVMQTRFTLIQSTLLSNQLHEIDQKFLNNFPEVNFSCFSHRTSSAYSMVENGSADTAIITSPQYSKFVDTIPIFKDTILIVSSKKLSDEKVISASALDPSKELLFSWSQQIDAWHNIHFSNAKQYEAWNRHNIFYNQPTVTRAYTDNIDMLENFLNINNIWFFSTSITAEKLKNHPNFHCYEVTNGPPAWEVYYLKNKDINNKYLDHYINCIKESLPKSKYITIF